MGKRYPFGERNTRMSKRFASIILSIFFLTCSVAETYQIVVEQSGTKIVTGTFDRDLFRSDADLHAWFETNYKEYSIDMSTVPTINSLSKGMHFVLVIGTWCGDSKRQVPPMLKTLDAAQVSNDQVTIFGVDRSKKSADGFTEKYRILRVPTLIVMHGEQELGRIVETPRETVEKDLVRILNKQ